mmetsp:Transcript_25305/g.57525  ORF Transcript_25305/g.57525 Transcript_25305/m.57525 type:complete len:231 (-) Transcript_25305:837-1529(-)
MLPKRLDGYGLRHLCAHVLDDVELVRMKLAFPVFAVAYADVPDQLLQLYCAIAGMVDHFEQLADEVRAERDGAITIRPKWVCPKEFHQMPVLEKDKDGGGAHDNKNVDEREIMRNLDLLGGPQAERDDHEQEKVRRYEDARKLIQGLGHPRADVVNEELGHNGLQERQEDKEAARVDEYGEPDRVVHHWELSRYLCRPGGERKEADEGRGHTRHESLDRDEEGTPGGDDE